MECQNGVMLIRDHDDGSDDENRWRSFVTGQGFGQLVACGLGRRVPVVVPSQFVLDADTVILHLAKPNPIFGCLEENDRCVMSVAGEWAYIPGSWKAVGDEDPRRGIPTTYYGSVQLTGSAAIIDDPSETASVLRIQLAALEPDGDYVDPSEHGNKLSAIRGLLITVTEVRAKFKYGGNVDLAHRAQVADRLFERGHPGDVGVAGRVAT